MQLDNLSRTSRWIIHQCAIAADGNHFPPGQESSTEKNGISGEVPEHHGIQLGYDYSLAMMNNGCISKLV